MRAASGKWQVTKIGRHWWVIDPCGVLCDHLFYEQSTALLTCRYWFERWGWKRWPNVKVGRT